jgi:D-psicose/D-tagatose/L-ribulose 3-epimerase
MKFGVNMFIWGVSFGPADFHRLDAIQAAGFDGIEIPILDPERFEARAVGAELDRRGLARTACSAVPVGASLAAADAAERERGRRHFRDCFDRCAEAGIELLAGPFYTPVGTFTGGRRTVEEWHRVVGSWQELASAAAAAGVDVAIEPLNRFETYFLNTAADAMVLCDAIGHPAVGILFDTFHANIEEKSAALALRNTARHLKHVHTSENDRGTPGSGHVDWTAVLSTVREIGYDRWLTIESFGFATGPMAAAASIWRDLAPAPELIAFDGLRFLKHTMASTDRSVRS